MADQLMEVLFKALFAPLELLLPPFIQGVANVLPPLVDGLATFAFHGLKFLVTGLAWLASAIPPLLEVLVKVLGEVAEPLHASHSRVHRHPAKAAQHCVFGS